VNQSSFKPFFSILISTYNRRALLEEALHSVFNQTFKGPYEVVVVDDGSTDDTWEYLKELSKEKGNLVIARHEKNLGISEGRKTAYKLSQGDYLLYFDSDDLLIDEALERVYQTLKETEAECLILSVYTEKKGKRKAKIFPDPKESPMERLKDFLLGLYSEALYVFKKNLLKEFIFPVSLRVREDLPIKGYFFTSTRPVVIKEPLGVIRDHPERLRKKPAFYLEDTLKSVEALFKNLPAEFQILLPIALGLAHFEIGIKLAQSRNYKEALKHYKKAKEIYPELKKDKRFLKKYLKASILSFNPL